MKNIYKYFRSVRIELKIILAISFSIYLLIELVLRNFPPLFSNASSMADLISNLCASYISAFIFYFVVVHAKSEKDKENIYEYIGHEVYSIITNGHLFIQPLMQLSDPKARFYYPSSEELGLLLSSVNKYDTNAPISFENGEKGNWIDWFEFLKRGILENINEILAFNHMSDSELIKLIQRIKNCMFFTQYNLLYEDGFGITLSVLHTQIHYFLNNLQQLEDYADEHLKEYKYITGEFMGRKSNV